MLLILEIVLTISAWRRGWKAWALLPLGIAMSAAFIFGIVAGAAGGSEGGIFAVALIFDLICTAVLIGMVMKPRRRTQVLPVPEHTTETPAIEAN